MLTIHLETEGRSARVALSAPPTEKPAETSTGLATLLGQLMSNRRAAREERRAIRRQWRINRRS